MPDPGSALQFSIRNTNGQAPRVLPPRVALRWAIPDDADTLAEMRLAFLAEVNQSVPPPTLPTAMRRYFHDHLGDGDFIARLAEHDGRIVATSGLLYCHCPPSYSNPAGTEGYILNMYTVPAWRGRSIGACLLEDLIERARAQGCGRVSLHAEPGARPLYERAGFTASETEMLFDFTPSNWQR